MDLRKIVKMGGEWNWLRRCPMEGFCTSSVELL